MADLTLTNPTYNNTGKFGQSLILNGSTSGYGTATEATPVGGTTSCWFKTSANALQVLLSQANGWIGLNGSALRFAWSAGSGNSPMQEIAGAYNDGAWHHLAVVWSATAPRVYVDGVLKLTGTAGVVAGTGGMVIGNLGGSYYFTGEIDEIAQWSSERYTGSSYTVPTAVYDAAETGLVHLFHLDGAGTDAKASGGTTPTTQTIAYAAATAIKASPYNWYDNGTALAASNDGAYLRFSFTGTRINIVIAALTGLDNYPTARLYVDGRAPVDVLLVSGQTKLTFYDGNLASGTHQAKLVLISSPSASNRWNEGNTLKITGFEIDTAATIGAPSFSHAKNAIGFSDSTLQGVGLPTAEVAALALVAEGLDAEFGQIGWASQGFAQAGYGVPALNSGAYGLYTAGKSRLVGGVLSPAPDYVLCQHGTNGAPTQADVATAIANFRTIAPAAYILMIVPILGYARAVITAAVAAAVAAGDAKVILIDAGTMENVFTNNGDNLHPVERSQARAASAYTGQIAAALRPRRFTVIPA